VASDGGKRVFISYVREDSDQVDGLCSLLEDAGIPYWRDKSDLGPGENWKIKIREAIRSGSLVFLACFSEQYLKKETSYMNEELNLAIEEIRARQPDKVWFIPIRFDDAPIPEWPIGPGRTLHDLQNVDLFGATHGREAVRLIGAIEQVMDTSVKNVPAPAPHTRVNSAVTYDRVSALGQTTAEMILDPSRAIELNRLVAYEISQIKLAMRDEDHFPLSGFSVDEDIILAAAKFATEYWNISKPFCSSLQVAAQFGLPDQLRPWQDGLTALCVESFKPLSGLTALIGLRDIPCVVSTLVCALACSGAGRWDNLEALLIDTTVVSPRHQNRRVPIVDVVEPFKPFSASSTISNTLAYSTHERITLEEALAALTDGSRTSFYAPVFEWLHDILRPVFADQYPDDEMYDHEFDRAEIILGFLTQDRETVRSTTLTVDPDPDRIWPSSPKWYGRAAWRANRHYGDHISDLAEERDRDRDNWPLLRAGLFGGDIERAITAMSNYRQTFDSVRSGQW
jgi:hypothetical protein